MAIHDHGTFEGWIPDEFFDESVPTCRPHPTDWLVWTANPLRLASRHEAFEDPSPFDPEDEYCVGMRVAEGDRVGFEGLTTFGDIRVRIDGPHAFQALDPVPVGATCFCVDRDMDTFAGNLADLVENYADAVTLGDVSDVIKVECYDWSSRAFVLRGGVFVEAAPDRPEAGAETDHDRWADDGGRSL